jgi:tetratricopeptide (TPR) repeat protein
MDKTRSNIYYIQQVWGMSVGDNTSNIMQFGSHASASVSAPYRGILSNPSLTDIRIIQQRTELVKDLHTKLTASDCNGLILTGIGGVGKSTLAALIYRYIKEQSTQLFTGTPLWLHIDPSTTFVDILGTLYKALDAPLPQLSDLSPANQVHDLFHLLSTTTFPRLIVLDQFENLLDWQTGKVLEDQSGIAKLLDVLNNQPLQSRCRILLTSRLRPQGIQLTSLIYLQEYHVEGLSMQESTNLLQKGGVEATETELYQVANICEGHTLSLTLLIALARDYRMSLTSLLEEPPLWIGDIAVNLLDAMWQKMTTIQRDLLKAFSIYRIPVVVDAAIKIANLNRSQALIGLRTLLKQHLLQPVGIENYQLHPIVTHYALQRISISDENTNHKTMLEVHKQAAQYCTQVGLQEISEGKLDTTFCMEAMWHYTQARQWHEVYRFLTEYQLFHILDIHGAYITIFELCQQLLTANEWTYEPHQRAEVLFYLGHSYEIFGDVVQAVEYYKQSLNIYHEQNIITDEVRLLISMGNAYCQYGDPQRGLHFTQQALHLCQSDDMQSERLMVLIQLGLINRYLGDMEQALRYYHQGLSLRDDDLSPHPGLLNNLGEVYRNLGETQKAIEYYHQCLAILTKIENRRLEAVVLGNLGLAYQALGENLEAVALFQQSFFICRKIGYRLGEGTALHNESGIYLEQGYCQKAIDLFQQTLTIRREIGDCDGEAFTLYQLGIAYGIQKDYEKALDYMIQSLHLHRKSGNRFHEVGALEGLGKIYWILYKDTEAINYLRQALTLSQEVKDNRNEVSILMNIGQIFDSNNQHLFALAAFHLARFIIDINNYNDIFSIQYQINKISLIFGELISIINKHITVYASQILDYALKNYAPPNEQTSGSDENIPTINVFWDLGTDTMTFYGHKTFGERSMTRLLYSRSSMKSSMQRYPNNIFYDPTKNWG